VTATAVEPTNKRSSWCRKYWCFQWVISG